MFHEGDSADRPVFSKPLFKNPNDLATCCARLSFPIQNPNILNESAAESQQW
jgi:hypothetical protein